MEYVLQADIYPFQSSSPKVLIIKNVYTGNEGLEAEQCTQKTKYGYI